MKNDLKQKISSINGVNFLAEELKVDDTKAVKNLVFQLEKEIGNAFIVLGLVSDDKPQLMVAISENLVKEKNLHAGNIVRELAKLINGGGGGQPFFATAGGKKVEGIREALSKAKTFIS